MSLNPEVLRTFAPSKIALQYFFHVKQHGYDCFLCSDLPSSTQNKSPGKFPLRFYFNIFLIYMI